MVLPKSDLRKALNYLRNHWAELRRYLDDPPLPMDNNECEQLMKQVALGRKNWLFAGSVAGGERNAGFLTLTSSAHRNDLDVRERCIRGVWRLRRASALGRGGATGGEKKLAAQYQPSREPSPVCST